MQGSGVHAHFRAVDNDLSVFFCIWQTMTVSGLALILGIVALVLGAVMKCADLHCTSTNPEDGSAVFANSPLCSIPSVDVAEDRRLSDFR